MDSPTATHDQASWVAPVCGAVSVVAVCVTAAYLARQPDSAKNIRALGTVIFALSGASA